MNGISEHIIEPRIHTCHISAYENKCFFELQKKYPKDTAISCDNLTVTYKDHTFQTKFCFQCVDGGVYINLELYPKRDFRMLRK